MCLSINLTEHLILLDNLSLSSFFLKPGTWVCLFFFHFILCVVMWRTDVNIGCLLLYCSPLHILTKSGPCHFRNSGWLLFCCWGFQLSPLWTYTTYFVYWATCPVPWWLILIVNLTKFRINEGLSEKRKRTVNGRNPFSWAEF